MGSAKSVVAKDGPNQSGNEIASDAANLFASELMKLKDTNISEEEARQLFMKKIEEYEESVRRAKLEASPSEGMVKSADQEIEASPPVPISRSKSFVENCERMASMIICRGATTFCVCTDGSDASAIAFKSALNLRRKHDCLTVLHASKSLERTSMKEEHVIRKVYEPVIIQAGLPEDKYEFAFPERFDRSVVETLEDYIENTTGSKHPDFLVFGCAGKKKNKERKTSNDFDAEGLIRPLAVPTMIVKQFFSMLGSTADMALRSLPIPCIIAKKTCPPGPKTFIMAVKQGEHSQRGLDLLLKLIAPRDTLRVVHINQPDETDEMLRDMEEYYTGELKDIGPVDSEYMNLPGDGYGSIVDAILDHINGPQSPDFFALAPRAQMKKMSDSTEALISKCKTSVILCKN